jgi:hypothetical protein
MTPFSAIPWDTDMSHTIYDRWDTIQDFATHLAQAMQQEIIIVWGVDAPQPTHLLVLETADGTWQAAYYTVEDLAHRLHTLGMHYWATQRRQYRQCQKGRDTYESTAPCGQPSPPGD